MSSLLNDDVIFVYSEEQVDRENEIYNKIGMMFKCGTVAVGKEVVRYSKMINDTEEDLNHMIKNYPDTKIIYKGKRSKTAYTTATEVSIKEKKYI